jgi:hypothetical protein
MPTDIATRGPDDVVMRFAAEEMARYAAKVTGEGASVGEAGPGANLLLQVDPRVGPGDAFLLRSGSEGLTIAAGAPRGVLYGVYAYLESLGVRFPFPGEEHEVVPRRGLALDGRDRREAPSFARRGMTFSGTPENARGWIDFCGKHRINWVFHHSQFEDDWWIGARGTLWPELQKRGMALELGGHYLPHFVPRELFHEHPEWFRIVDGARVNDTNFCPSSRPAVAYLQERVRRYVSEMPEAEVYNVWADDTAEDASTWCFCPQCRQYSPSDQNLVVMNAMAEAVRDVKPTARLVCIAYHETVVPPEKVAPAPGVVLMFAPRERCYAHALDDPDCAKNRRHAAWLERLVQIFDPAEAEVFEYYPDQVVFNHMVPALPDTIAGDVRYYRRLGIGLIEPLLTPFTQPWLSPPASAILQCRALWDVDADLHAALADHARTYYGDELAVEYFEHRERGLNRAIRACDFDHPVAAFWTPPLDRPEATGRYLAGLEEAFDDLRRARRALANAGHVAVGRYAERITDEERAFDLAGRRVNGLTHYARGVLAYNRFRDRGQPEDARAAVEHFEHAYADLNAIRARHGRPNRTFAHAERLIRRALAESGAAPSDGPSAGELIARLPDALVPERAAGIEGAFTLALEGEGGGVWTVELRDGACRVAEGAAAAPTATLRIAVADFVGLMLGELSPSAVRWRGTTRMSGDAASLMRLPEAFRLRS